MAHYARVQNGIVVDVHVLNNAVITDPDGHEVEALGQTFLANLWGYDPLHYVQCSYNATMRGCYPGVGYTYDPVINAFSPPVGEGAVGVNTELAPDSPLAIQGFDETGYTHDT